MNEQETLELGKVVTKLKQMGYTILLIEHDMKFVMSRCEYIYVINHGEQIAEGTPQEVTTNPLVVEAYLGKEED
jgi:branched-chain amino acid transport system ATP-binding protein